MKKFLAIVLAAMMALALVACGGSSAPAASDSKPAANTASEPAKTEAKDEAPAAEAKSYQLEGVYAETGDYAATINGAFLCNLNADGTAVIDRYKYANYNTAPAAENPTYEANFMTGTWKAVEKDGIESLQIKVACVDAAGNESNAGTFYANEVAGEWSFDLNFPIVVGAGYTRTVTLTGGETQKYADADSFLQAYKQEFVAPEHVGEFVAEDGAVAYLFEDGTLAVYVNFAKSVEGTWSNADGIKIALDGKDVEVKTEGNSASFDYTRDRGDGENITSTLVCADVTALPAAEAKEAEAPAEDAPYVGATIVLGESNSFDPKLTLNADGTGTLNVAVDMAVKVTKVGNAAVLEPNGEFEGFAAQIFPAVPHTWLLDDETKTMTALNGAWTDGLKAFYAIDETTMTVALPAYSMSAEGFTYELSEDGAKLTVTAPAELSAGFTQVWGGAGLAKTFTVDGVNVAEAE